MEQQEDIAKATKEFYKKQLTMQVDEEDYDMLKELPCVVNDLMNKELQRVPTMKEVHEVVMRAKQRQCNRS